MREIRVEMPGFHKEGECAGRLTLNEASEARLSSMLRGGVTVQIVGAAIVDNKDHILSLTLAPEPAKGAVAPHTEVQDGDRRVAYNPGAADRVAYLSMRIGEAFAHAVTENHSSCISALQDAAAYIRQAACVQEPPH